MYICKMNKEELYKKLIDFDTEFGEMMKDSKYCRFLCDESYNKHLVRLGCIAYEKRIIMKELEKMNVMKTFEKDFTEIKKKYKK